MTFLNPALLFGLLAAGIPVLIHLLNLRKLKKIEISTLYFLHELQKNKIKKIKLKQLLLLLLRVLIVIALVMAFARPTLQTVSFGGTSAVKTTAVFIIDDSYSMNRVVKNGSMFNLARQYVKQHLANLQEGDEAAILFTSAGRSGKPVLTANNKELLQKLDEAKISEISKPLHESVLAAAELFGSSDNFNKEFYILSDLQASTLIADSLYSDMSALLGERVRVYVFPFASADIYNIGIDSMQVNSAILQKDKNLSTTLYIRNYTNEPAKSLVASLFINGERVAQKGFAAEPGGVTELPLEAAIKHTGYLDITAVLEDDDLLADNKVFASVYVPEEIAIGIFEKQPGDSRFLIAALHADDSLKAIKTTVLPMGQIAAANLDKFDMLFVIGADAGASYNRLNDFIKAGRGVFITPGTGSSSAEISALNTALGLPAINSMQEAKDTPLPLYCTGVDEYHPLFSNIFRQREKKTIDSPELYKLMTATVNGQGKNVLPLNNGNALITEYRMGKGKVLFMGTAPLPSWSNLPFKGFFIPLLFRSVYYLSAKESSGNTYFTGNEITIELKHLQGATPKLVKPDGSNELLNASGNTTGIFQYTQTDLSGIYKLFSGGKVAAAFPVNHRAAESHLESVGFNGLQDYFSRLHAKSPLHEIKNPDNSVNEVKEARYGAELWKLFIILTLILALAESMIARNAKKELASL